MLQENILKEAPCLYKSSHGLPNISPRFVRSTQRILRSPMPNKHPDWTFSVLLEELLKILT